MVTKLLVRHLGRGNGLGLALAGAAAVLGCDPTGGNSPNASDGGVAACAEIGSAPRGFPDRQQLRVTSEVDDRQRIVAPADTCDRGEYFIETAYGAATPCGPFRDAVEVALEDALADKLCNYLGTDDEESDQPYGRIQTPGVPKTEFDPKEFCQRACQATANPDDKQWERRGDASFNVSIVPVFKPIDGAELPLPADAENRFFRIKLVATSNGRESPITIPHASVCTYLEDIREAVRVGLEACADADPGPGVCMPPEGERMLVGRECQILNSGFEATAEMLNWHVERLGIREAVVGEAADTDPRVVLLDSGVEDGMGLRTRLLADGSVDSTAPDHPHGSLMAALIKQVNPGVNLASVRALGNKDRPSGLGTTAELARAIWTALSHPELQSTPQVPLILNLSVGWPQSLSRPRRVRGTRRIVSPDTGRWGYEAGDRAVCETVEDGPGEAVRYALAMAYHSTKLREDQPVSAYAAAGNRSHAYRGEGAVVAAAVGHLRCGDPANDPRLEAAWCVDGVSRDEAPLYLPALWGFEGVSGDPWAPEQCLAPARIVEPIAALDERDLPAAADPAIKAPPLALPGEHIYAPAAGLNRALVPVGGLCDSNALRRRKQALPLTGTSVSAALATGMAAAVQAKAIAVRGQAFSARDLTRFLYVTGTALPGLDGLELLRSSLENLPVRRPNLCHALGLLDRDCGRAVADCVVTAAGASPDERIDAEPALGGNDLQACADQAEVCLAELEGCTLPAVAPPTPLAGYPPATAASSSCLSNRFSGDPVTGWVPTVGAPLVSNSDRKERGLPAAIAGIVGPQPPIPVCPDCLFNYDAVGKTVSLTIDVSAKVPTGTLIERPRVLVYDTRTPTRAGSSQLLELTGSAFTMTPVVATTSWKAGTRVTIKGPAPVGTGQLSALATDWRTFFKAELLCNVSGSSAITSPIDVSTLRIQAVP